MCHVKGVFCLLLPLWIVVYRTWNINMGKFRIHCIAILVVSFVSVFLSYLCFSYLIFIIHLPISRKVQTLSRLDCTHNKIQSLKKQHPKSYPLIIRAIFFSFMCFEEFSELCFINKSLSQIALLRSSCMGFCHTDYHIHWLHS